MHDALYAQSIRTGTINSVGKHLICMKQPNGRVILGWLTTLSDSATAKSGRGKLGSYKSGIVLFYIGIASQTASLAPCNVASCDGRYFHVMRHTLHPQNLLRGVKQVKAGKISNSSKQMLGP